MGKNSRAFAQLDSIIAKINTLSTGQFRTKAVEAIAETMYGLAEEGIAAGRNPRGVAWRRLAPGTKNSGLPLRIASSSLRRAIFATVAKVAVEFPHALAHQKGARRVTLNGKSVSGKQIKAMNREQRQSLNRGWRLPARSMVPNGGRLPPRWRDAINARMTELFGKVWST